MERKVFESVDNIARPVLSAFGNISELGNASFYVVDCDDKPVAILNIFRHDNNGVTLDICTNIPGVQPSQSEIIGWDNGKRTDYAEGVGGMVTVVIDASEEI